MYCYTTSAKHCPSRLSSPVGKQRTRIPTNPLAISDNFSRGRIMRPCRADRDDGRDTGLQGRPIVLLGWDGTGATYRGSLLENFSAHALLRPIAVERPVRLADDDHLRGGPVRPPIRLTQLQPSSLRARRNLPSPCQGLMYELASSSKHNAAARGGKMRWRYHLSVYLALDAG